MYYNVSYYVEQATSRSIYQGLLTPQQISVLNQFYSGSQMSSIISTLNSQTAIVAGKTTLNLYNSYDSSGLWMRDYATAAATAPNSTSFTIDQTPASTYLTQQQATILSDFNAALTAAGVPTIAVTNQNGLLTPEAYEVLEPIGRINSENTVVQAKNAGLTLDAYVGQNPTADSVLAGNEVPTAIRIGADINGFTPSQLSAPNALANLSNYTTSTLLSNVTLGEDLTTQSPIDVTGSTTDPYITEAQALSSLPAGESTSTSVLTEIGAALTKIATTSPALATALGGLFNGLTQTGYALMAYDILDSGITAGQQANNNNFSGALLTIQQLEARIALGLYGAQAGAEVIAGIGSLAGPVGTVVGGIVGGIAGAIAGVTNANSVVNTINQGVQNAVNYLSQTVAGNDPSFSAALGGNSSLSSVLTKNSAGLYQLPSGSPLNVTATQFFGTLDTGKFSSDAQGDTSATIPNSSGNQVIVGTSGSSTLSPGSAALGANEYTGYTANYTINSSGKTYTATVLYRDQSGLYVIDGSTETPVNGGPNIAIGGPAVLDSSVTVNSVTAPTSPTTTSVITENIVNNNDGSVTNNTLGITSGTVAYSQTTNTATSGAVSANISGTGDDASLNNASVALSDNTLATLSGRGNGTTAGNHDTLTVDSSSNTDTTTVTGTGTTVTDNGASDTITLQGNSSSATMNGTGAVATSTGSSDNVIATGASASVTETGGGDSVTTYGTGSTVNASGTGDGVVFEGNSETATLTGAQDNINFYGTSDSDTSSGASSTGNVYGSSDNFINIGNNSVATVSGNGDSVTTYGTGSTVSESGTGDGVVFEGNTQTATLTGSQDNVYAHGTGDSATSSGGSDTGTAYGNTDNLIFTGANSVATASGSGDSITAWGSGSTINETGNGDGAVLEGASQSVSLGGANETATTHATSDNVNMSSTGDAAVLMGTNDSGTLTGTSDTNSYATDTTTLSGESVDITAKDTSTGGITFTDVASGSGSGDYNFSGSSTLTGVANDTLLNTGSYSLDNANLSSGGSIESFFGFNNNIIETAADYTGGNGSGELSTAAVGLTDGITVDDAFSYNGSGAETGFQEDWYDGSSFIAYANFTASGSYINGDDGGALAGDGGFGDGGEFELATGTSGGSGTNVANFSQFDSTLPNNATATQQAQIASAEINSLMQAPSTGNTTADQALYEGAKWGSKVITWSLANSAGPTDSPFSSYMGTQYQSLVQEALNAWGAASGLTFTEVSDSSQADIRIGWGDFNTSLSGVVGYTTYQTQNGLLQPDSIVRLEDPSQDALQTTTGGTLQYSGTTDSVYELLLHELGHALGLADNNDPNSVMYYKAGASSTTLDSNDTTGMQTLYGSLIPSGATTQLIQNDSSTASGVSLNSMLQQMIQANASFLTQPGSATTASALSSEFTSPMLVTPSHLTQTTAA
jgi:hypothetical protein